MALRCSEALWPAGTIPFRSGFVVTSDRPNPLSIGAPAQALGFGDTRSTSPLDGGAAPLMGSPNWDEHGIASECNSPHPLRADRAPRVRACVRRGQRSLKLSFWSSPPTIATTSPQESEQDDKWSFCLTAARCAQRISRDNEQTTPPEPHTGLQGEGGACRHQGDRTLAQRGNSSTSTPIRSQPAQWPPHLMNGRALVAWNLRRVRVKRGLSQERLAFDAGVDRSYLGGLERQEENPTVDVLDRLASALSIPISEFFVSPGKGSLPPRPLKSGRRPAR
jgi:DNA-binding XRE family transcriptional regulator